MLNKNKLLTGVVFPLMSIAIAVDPVVAANISQAHLSERPAQQASFVPGEGTIILAQAEQPNPEELPRKRREQSGEEQQRQQQEEAPRPRREAQPEAAPEPQQERPRREAHPEQQQERPRREQQREQPQPEAETQQRQQEEPAPRPRRNAQPDAAPAEAQPEQQQERPRRQREQQPQDGESQQRPRRDAQPDATTGEAQPEQQQERPRRQRDQQPAADGAEQQQRQGERPRRNQETQPAAGEATPEKPAVPETKPAAPEPEAGKAPVPAEPPTPGRAPAPAEQPNPAPGQQPSEQPRPPRGQNGEPAPAPVPGAPPAAADGATTGQAPAGEAVPAQVVTPQTEAKPMTKEQLDKARAIAQDPSKSADTVVLPVDKGAAVLDSDKEAYRSGNEQLREQRRREREQVQDFKVPTSDAEAQAAARRDGGNTTINIQNITNVQGERIDRRPDFDRPDGVREWRPRDMPRDRDMGDRVFLQFGDRVVVRGNDDDRFISDGAKPYYERLPGDRYRETIERPDRTQVVTIRNRYGDVIQRSRIDARGREYVLFYAPELVDQPDREYVYRDPGLDLPPLRLRIPVNEYIIDTSSDEDRDYYRFLEQPPVEPVQRVYTMDEVRYSARVRDMVRRIDLDTITFATGSAEIPMSQAQSLRKVADAINKVLQNNPAETFLIEGHTDAVGSDESNLVLSDERASSVASVLTEVYGIPPENLTTQGYGERYLKVQTLGPSQENRRVTIRRITPLVRPVAQN
ncbi:OmpA family protein [Agrobacterium larrymoorei]|uniref:OmpA family protein n=1 Tax=Agrobacterium larrymoorei TaxID=160699 RepID=UPI001572C8E1|nr:OmpA family protein [Agrobacterium larrymoorei]NTJ42604.1 OmpA family protein [Agrobacterium larrymoorei]